MAVDGDVRYAKENVTYAGTETSVDECAVLTTVAERGPYELISLKRVE